MVHQLVLRFCLLGWLMIVAVFSQAQSDSPYTLSFEREIIYGWGGLLSFGAGELLKAHTRPLNYMQLRNRDHSDFDEVAIGLFSIEAHKWSDFSMYFSVGLTSLFLAKAKTRNEFGKISILFSEVMLLNGGLTNVSKSLFKRPRPYVFGDSWDVNRILSNGDRAAFVSGHTSGSAASAFFFARVFTDYYPDSRLKPWVWSLAISLPALTGYLRVKAGKHYPSDVVAGYLMGASIGYLVPTLHKKTVEKGELSLQPTGQGFHLNWKF